MGRFAVVQDTYELSDWEVAAQIVMEVLGVHPTAAKQRARRSRGFLGEKLAHGTAERIREACKAQGLTTYVVPETSVVRLPKPTRVHALRIADDALWIRRKPTGLKEPIDWISIVLMAAYEIAKKESFHQWSTEYNFAARVSELHADKYTKDYAEYVADIFGSSRDGRFLRLRLASRELNYQEALGSDLADPVWDVGARDDNFRLVLARIHARASGASVPLETLALLGAAPDPNCRLHHLDRLEDFEAYNRWLLQKMRLASLEK